MQALLPRSIPMAMPTPRRFARGDARVDPRRPRPSRDATRKHAVQDAVRNVCCVRTLRVTHLRLTDDVVAVMAAALCCSRTLETLDLTCNRVGPRGAAALASALRTNGTLQTLCLASNAIGSAGARALGNALKQNATLRVLNLTSNQVEANGAQALADALAANSTLQTLTLTCNQLGSAGAARLADGLKSNSTLRELALMGNEIAEEGACCLAQVISRNTGLQTLDLACNPIGTAGAAAFVESLRVNATLQTLVLTNCRIEASESEEDTDLVASALSANSTLRVLDLRVNDVSEDLARTLLEARRVVPSGIALASALTRRKDVPEVDEFVLRRICRLASYRIQCEVWLDVYE